MRTLLSCLIVSVLGLGCACMAFAQSIPATPGSNDASLETMGTSDSTRFAPGQSVPFSVKLVNFGSDRRVDVTLTYEIIDSDGSVIETQGETVAVETTASFVRRIALPQRLAPGSYTLLTTIEYDSRSVPTTSRFDFTVEPQLLGIFIDDALWYGALALFLGAALSFLLHLLMQRREPTFALADYTDKPRNMRVYYEIIDTTIRQMRLRIGDTALMVAASVSGLFIDPDTGAVLDIRGAPASVIETLVLRYEAAVGERVRTRPQILKILNAAPA